LVAGASGISSAGANAARRRSFLGDFDRLGLDSGKRRVSHGSAEIVLNAAQVDIKLIEFRLLELLLVEIDRL
jgi:hypothetical protein